MPPIRILSYPIFLSFILIPSYFLKVPGIISCSSGIWIFPRRIPLCRRETDCPFLPTQRFEGQPATSDMLEDVVEAIARARGDITPQEVAEVAKQNAERFLGIRF